ncbi:MAG: hypothetical protein CMM45_04060 [Rhodospirillaceae bacterium]|nr:hypothetical protein [Rhodospirillaceae bacterium]
MRSDYRLVRFVTFLLACQLFVTALTLPATGQAQSLNLASGAKDQPIEIIADNGIEWQQENEILIASGNAKASRGGINVEAEVIRAYYKQKSEGGADLYRLDAVGGVKIHSSTDSIVGETAVYDIEKAILRVDGRKVVFKSGNDTISATEQMEYWERQKMAVARGRAVAAHQGKTVRADILKALMREKKDGKSEVYIVEAFDNVLIISEQDRVRADRGIYKIDSGIATLAGNITITRADSILTGDQAEVNLKTGVSKLLTADPVRSDRRKKKRIRGLIYPQKR